MFVVREARPEDATAVVPFLVNMLMGQPSAYQSIFTFAQSRIGRTEGDAARPLGAVLERPDGSIAGFLGLLASRMPRLTPGWVQHLTSWAVAPDARGQGLRLLYHVVHTHPGIFANFSATAAVQAILPRFGFTQIDEAELTFSNWSFVGVRNRFDRSAAIDLEAIEFAPHHEQACVIRDHLAMGCRAFATEQGGQKIVAVMLRLGSGRHATAQLIHLSPVDENAIRAIWPGLKGFALYDMRCPRVRVDARYAPSGEEPLARKPRYMFAKNFTGHPRDLTRAYGEPLNAWALFGLATGNNEKK